jgi:hypothetical protein
LLTAVRRRSASAKTLPLAVTTQIERTLPMTSQLSHTLGELEAEHQAIDELEEPYVASLTSLEAALTTDTGIEGDQVGH